MRRPERPKSKNTASLMRLIPFLKTYQLQAFAAGFFLIFTSVATLSLGQGIKWLIDWGIVSESSQDLSASVLLFLLLGLAISAGTYFRHYFVSLLGENVTNDIRKGVFKRVLSLDPEFFEKATASEIQSRLTTDVTVLQTLIGSSLSMALRNLLAFIGGILFLFFTNLKLSLLVTAAVPLILGPILIYGGKLRKLARDTQARMAALGIKIHEDVFHIKTIQAFNLANNENSRFNDLSRDYMQTVKKRILLRSFFFGSSIFFVIASIAAMLWVGAADVADGSITAGALASFIFYAFMIASSVASLSEVAGDLQRAAGATERLLEIAATIPGIQNPEYPVSSDKKSAASLEIRGVSFHYNSAPQKKVLKNISFHIEPGMTCALVGPSGAGKSTLFDLVLRFYDPVKGSVLFDGIDIRQYALEDYRSDIAIVPQQPAIFSGTVMDNILIGRPNASAKEIRNAARLAYADEFIQKLAKGYDSELGENGIMLSGGQKQRVAIARAILRNPRLLLLDEATNSLDAESEHRVQQAFKNLRRHRTTLVIAHRLATVVDSDIIFVLNQGKITEFGKHDTLLKKSELYRRFCELQLVR